MGEIRKNPQARVLCSLGTSNHEERLVGADDLCLHGVPAETTASNSHFFGAYCALLHDVDNGIGPVFRQKPPRPVELIDFSHFRQVGRKGTFPRGDLTEFRVAFPPRVIASTARFTGGSDTLEGTKQRNDVREGVVCWCLARKEQEIIQTHERRAFGSDVPRRSERGKKSPRPLVSDRDRFGFGCHVQAPFTRMSVYTISLK